MENINLFKIVAIMLSVIVALLGWIVNRLIARYDKDISGIKEKQETDGERLSRLEGEHSERKACGRRIDD